LSSRFGKLEHIEGKKCFGKVILVRKVNCFTIDYQFIKWCLDHYKTTLAVVVLFFSSIALVPFDSLVESFAKSDSGEFLVQIELPKDASLEQSNFMAQRQKLLNTQKYVKV
jgi:HAE1 family hydrophobic/amphiphilic exporter-1